MWTAQDVAEEDVMWKIIGGKEHSPIGRRRK